ncbi:MAG: cobalamin B12-binding domain-containing protein, partial [Hadesarchaea archaeon]|nr:cobalamin B12-binding domain-containing protein [Hadesarchaea archaeon]
MSTVLFIYPPVSFQDISPLAAYSPPLGILYLGTILKNKGHEVHVIDVEAEHLSLSQVIKRVESIDPEVIG